MSPFNQNKISNEDFSKTENSNQFKWRLMEACCSTKTHGLPNILKAKEKTTKAMWIICFLVSLSFSAYSVIQSITNYLKFDVVSLTRSINEPYSELPAILLCNKKSIKIDYFNQIEMEEIESFANFSQNLSISDVHKKLEFTKKKFFSKFTDKKRFMILLDKFLISCRYGSWYCSVNDFEPFFHFSHGGCYMFNSNALKKYNNKSDIETIKIYRPGFQNSLQIELFVGEPNDQLGIMSSSVGFDILFLNSTDFSNQLDYLNLAPGFEYNIAIHKTIIEQIPKPYSNCQVDEANLETFNSEYFKIFRKSNLTYKQSDCVDLCYQILSTNLCNCTDFILDLNYNSTLCKKDNELNCIINFYYENFTKNNYIQTNCIPHCPLECKRIELSTTVSFSQYPSDNYFDILKNNQQLQKTVFKSKNWSYIRNSILKVNINFETLSYKYIRENVIMSVVDLLAYIGGQMSLFLGISVLSFFEIFELLYEVTQIFLKKV